MPSTWLVLDKNNKFTRDDFDTVSFKEDILPANKFASLDFLNDLATVSAGSGCTLREATAGAQVFSDRTYCFEESYLPAELVGSTYVSGPIGGNTATVTKAGYVVLAVGELSNYDTLNAKVKAAGWTQILYAAGTPYNFAVRTNIPDLVNWYVKYCKAGETINFGKWAVPFANGETEPFAWESKPASLILNTSDSYYSVTARKWHGCPTIEATNGGRLIAAWSTGDKAEGEPGNYDVLAYSDDNGKTWKEFGYVNSEKSGDPNKQTTICDIQLWLDRETNTLYIFYIARHRVKDIEEKGFFIVKNRTIQHRLNLPDEKNTKNPRRDIKEVIEAAITDIEDMHNAVYENGELKITPMGYSEENTIQEYLDKGYLKIEISGGWATSFTEISKAQKKQISRAKKSADKK